MESAVTQERERLADERAGITHRFLLHTNEGPMKGYLTVGCYGDGRPGELFVKLDRQGSTVSGFIDAWAISVSLLLQRGVPLEEICHKFRGMQFEPRGMTDNDEIRIVTSPIDYVVRWLERKFEVER